MTALRAGGVTALRAGVPGFGHAAHFLPVTHTTAAGATHVHDLAYIDSGTGPPVVMVHGNPTWGFLFRRMVTGLADRHRVLVPDHIGMGRSARPAPGTYEYTLASRIADLGAFIDAVVPSGRVDLVVHDWGGAIGLGWAARHPERVGRVLAANTVAFPLPPQRRLPWQLRLARSWPGAVLLRRAGLFNLAALAVGARARLDRQAVRGYLAPYRSAADRTAVLAFVRDIPVRPGDRAWRTLVETAAALERLSDTEFVICWGLRDPVFTPDLLDEWRRLVPGARIVGFPRAGHLVFDDAGDELLAIARELFDPARPGTPTAGAGREVGR